MNVYWLQRPISVMERSSRVLSEQQEAPPNGGAGLFYCSIVFRLFCFLLPFLFERIIAIAEYRSVTRFRSQYMRHIIRTIEKLI